MNHDAIREAVSAASPWLMLVLCLQRLATWRGSRVRHWGRLLGPGVVALVVLLIPVEGIAISRWVASLNANFSIPLIGILAVAVWEGAFERPIFAKQDWAAGWIFGAIGGLLLYPFALGVGSFDPYEWGWRFSPLFVVSALLTSWLIWKKNRFGFLLMLSIAAFHLSLLESGNYWDYLFDPVYVLLSVAVLGRRCFHQ
jgi:hypothetical protein